MNDQYYIDYGYKKKKNISSSVSKKASNRYSNHSGGQHQCLLEAIIGNNPTEALVYGQNRNTYNRTRASTQNRPMGYQSVQA